MKKNLLLVAIAATSLLFSCKKDNNSSPSANGKTYEATFTVNSFGSTSTTLAARTSSSGIGAHSFAAAIPVATPYLLAYFYDANSKLLSHVTQIKASTPGYGTITTQLPLGTVYAFFVATDDSTYTLSLSKKNSKDVAKMTGGYPVIRYSNIFGSNTTSVFTQAQALNVTAPFTQTVTLTRAATLLTIIADDTPTSSLQYFQYGQTYPDDALNLLEQTGENTIYTFAGQSLYPTVGKAGYTKSYIIWPGIGAKHEFSGYGFNPTPNGISKTLFAATDTVKANTHYTFEGYISNMRLTTSTIKTDTAWNAPVNKNFSVKLK